MLLEIRKYRCSRRKCVIPRPALSFSLLSLISNASGVVTTDAIKINPPLFSCPPKPFSPPPPSLDFLGFVTRNLGSQMPISRCYFVTL